MRYLRMLSNSLAAGVLATCYVLVLVLHLNPTLPLNPIRLAPLAATVGLFYAVHFTAICYIVLVGRQLLARELFSPAWASVAVLTWLGAVAAAAGAVLMWANLRTFGLVVEPATATAISSSATVLAVAAALLVAIGVVRRGAGRGRRRVLALSVVIVATASVAAPMALRGRGTVLPLEAHPLGGMLEVEPRERVSRLVMIAIDAGSLDLITNAAAEGRLPNFGRMLDAGAVMHLATIHPTSAEAVWAAVATGKLPQKNGVRSAGIYRLARSNEVVRLLPDFCFASGLIRFGFLTEEAHTSATVRTRALWSILNAHGVTVGVVNWPLTYPAPIVRGYVVSDVYSRLALTISAFDDPSILYPPDLVAKALPVVQAWAEHQPVAVAGATLPISDAHQQPGRTDRVYDQLAETLARTHPTQVTVVRYQSLDQIGHYFLRYAMPSQFGDVTEEERRTLGSVLERHYQLIDDAIGRAIGALEPTDLLLVVSGYGMEPLGLGKRILERLIGDPDVSGTHEAAPDGFLMAYGASVAKSRSVARASVVDVLPTALYFLGLPIGRDMDGYVRTDLFLPSFTAEHPITLIPTYER